MEKEVISYLDRKEDVYSWMNAQKPDINPISYGSSYVFYELGDVDNLRLCEYFIACGLFELEHHDLEERIEEQMTFGSINMNISEDSKVKFLIANY